MTRLEAFRELQDARKIFVTFVDWGYSYEYHSHFPYLMLWVEDKDDRVYPVYCEESGYYSKRKDAYAMRIWGSDRVLELIKSIVGYENCYKGSKIMSKVIPLLL